MVFLQKLETLLQCNSCRLICKVQLAVESRLFRIACQGFFITGDGFLRIIFEVRVGKAEVAVYGPESIIQQARPFPLFYRDCRLVVI